MSRFSIFVLLGALAMLAPGSNAGPNTGGHLVLIGVEAPIYSKPDCGYEPVSCYEGFSRYDGTDTALMFVQAAFPSGSSPRLSGVTFGIDYDDEQIFLAGFEPCGDFELPTSDWPSPGSGTAVTFASPETDDFIGLYWIAAYNYYGNPRTLDLIPHPTQGAYFADDSVPAVLDPIEELGFFGFSTDGYRPCPGDPPTEGACCDTSGDCRVVLEFNCTGEFLGEGVACDPNPCPQPQACCFESGICRVLFVERCESLLGIPYPEDSCDPNPCPQPPSGACCYPKGECEVRLVESCDFSGGEYLGDGTTCDPNPCPQPEFGACCFDDGGCINVTIFECADAEGVFQGGDTNCESFECPIRCLKPTPAGRQLFTRGQGPNVGGTLILHTDPGVVLSSGESYCDELSLPTCNDSQTEAPAFESIVIWAIAAFDGAASPRMAGITFGIDYASCFEIEDYGHCGDFELAASDWPEPGAGTAVTWSVPQESTLTPVYWFVGRVDSVDPTTLVVIPHPLQGGNFADDSVPATLDPIAGFGYLGFSTDGFAPCPGNEPLGACCFTDDRCEILLEETCLADGGEYQGPDVSCEDVDCVLGACCDMQGLCELVTVGECEAEGGIYLGGEVPCSPDPCDDFEGACCYAVDECITTRLEVCFELDGEFLGRDTVCLVDSCRDQIGACCLGEECFITSQRDCGITGGYYQGDDTTCYPNPCSTTPTVQSSWGRIKSRFGALSR